MNAREILFVMLTAGMLTAWLASASAAELCKWVDENGTVHYAQTCPDSEDAETVNVEGKEPFQGIASAGGSKNYKGRGLAILFQGVEGRRKSKFPSQIH